MRITLYARVSTDDQHVENQMQELRGYVAARGWATSVEFTDIGVSGAKSRRPALDRLVLAAGRRRERVVAGLARAKRTARDWAGGARRRFLRARPPA